MPGSTTWPEASMTRAPAGAASAGPTAAMRSPSTSTSARLSAAGVPARTCPPRISSAIGPSGSPALLPRGEQVVGVDLLEPHLALQLEVLGVEIARLLERGRVELAHRHLAAGDLARVHEARPHLRGAHRALRVHLGVRLDHVAHTLVEVLLAERVVRALEGRAQEGLEALGVLGDGLLAGDQRGRGHVEYEIGPRGQHPDVRVLLPGDLADARLVHHEER